MDINKTLEAHADSGTRLSLKLLPDPDGFMPLAVFAGDRSAMLLMADLFRAMADAESGEDFSMSPDGAGSAFFAAGSGLGIFIDRQ